MLTAKEQQQARLTIKQERQMIANRLNVEQRIFNRADERYKKAFADGDAQLKALQKRCPHLSINHLHVCDDCELSVGG